MALALPPSPERDEQVEQLLDLLRTARRELDDALRIVHLLSIDDGADPIPTRISIEQDVALRRVSLWAAEVTTAEAAARALGIDVRSIL